MVAQTTGVRRRLWRVLRRVVMDGSFLPLSAACCLLSVHRGMKRGVRVQMAYAVGVNVPTQLQMTSSQKLTKVNDVTAFKSWDLMRWRGWTVLLVLG